MPALTIPYSFSPNTTALSANVNANFSAISTLLNSTLLDSTNIQTSGIAASNLAASCVTGAKLNSNVVDNSTLQYSSSQLSIKTSGVGTTQIADSAVTTAKLNDGAVTQAKRAALGDQSSSSSGAYINSNSSFTDITNLTVTITTTGRPVFVALVSDGSGNASYFRNAGQIENIRILRDASEIAQYAVSNATVGGFPVCTVDTGASATSHTYKAQHKASSGNDEVNYYKMVAFEL